MDQRLEKIIRDFKVPPGKRISLENYPTRYEGDWPQKEDAGGLLHEGIEQLRELQDKLYAQDQYALLVILQGSDASGKDSTIKHVMSGVNPMGCQVYSFKQPSQEELDHDYLWRCCTRLPERGRIGIFNRSHYEEVLVVRVHPELLENEHLPPELRKDDIWERRFDQIKHFEKYLVENGIVVVKFFLHISKEEQKRRFLKRIEDPEKNWKFSAADVRERAYWDDTMKAYREALEATSSDWAPWYVIPADRKWFTRVAVAAAIVRTLEQLHLKYPSVTKERLAEMAEARRLLESEG